MTTATWRDLPIESVPIADLVTTQDHLDMGALLSGALRLGSDDVVHVIAHDGALYLEDGHHRVARAALRNERQIKARVLRRP